MKQKVKVGIGANGRERWCGAGDSLKSWTITVEQGIWSYPETVSLAYVSFLKRWSHDFWDKNNPWLCKMLTRQNLEVHDSFVTHLFFANAGLHSYTNMTWIILAACTDVLVHPNIFLVDKIELQWWCSPLVCFYCIVILGWFFGMSTHFHREGMFPWLVAWLPVDLTAACNMFFCWS